ncbi:hypothetical protein WR25_03587 [Diploscapter pachys]|uniref:PWWP domain-containing protein n=1 Tax=Diploscapter pachys TaxID=2018661 RepID=A0A2A2LGB4_9BILA|nr:hypothetical protein WR25_03587 [Diploscapter pachys]
MQRVWQWLREKKTKTMRRWRSSQLSRRQQGSTNNGDIGSKKKSRSEQILPSSSSSLDPSISVVDEFGQPISMSYKRTRSQEYEQFFEEPELKHILEVRRGSIRESFSEDLFPVAAPDVEAIYMSHQNERKFSSNLKNPSCLSPKSQRSPKQLRFQIPEVRVSFEEEEPHRLIFESVTDLRIQDMETLRSSPLPPPEIEWTSMSKSETSDVGSGAGSQSIISNRSMDTIPEVQLQPLKDLGRISLSFDEDTSSTASPRKQSASEKARQNLLAQRRQSNVQAAHSMSGRRSSTTLIPLTMAQIHLIRSLWRQVYTSKGPTVIGSSIFHRLCFKLPMVKEQIRRVPLPPKFSNHDSFVKAHSKAMAELIDQIVENLDNLDGVVEELMNVGRVHARILRGELTGKLWNTVAETIIDCTLEWGDKRCRSEPVRKGWALIVAFAIEKIKAGHHEQIAKMKSEVDSTQEVRQFETNQLIWARMKGFPPWPAQVMEVTEDVPRGRLPVMFFGTKETAYVKLPDCCPYLDNRNEFEVSRKHKGFNEAIHEIRLAAGISQPGEVDPAFPIDQRESPSLNMPMRQRTTSTRSYEAAQAYFEQFRKRSASESRSRADSAASALKQMQKRATREQKKRLNSESSAGSKKSKTSGFNYADLMEGNDSVKLIQDTFLGNNGGQSRRTRNSSSRVYEDYFINFGSGGRTRNPSGSVSSMGRNRHISCSGYSGISENLEMISGLDIKEFMKQIDDLSSESSLDHRGDQLGTPPLPPPFAVAPQFCESCGTELRQYNNKMICRHKGCPGPRRQPNISYATDMPSTSYGGNQFYSNDFMRSPEGASSHMLHDSLKPDPYFHSDRQDNYDIRSPRDSDSVERSALHTLAEACPVSTVPDEPKRPARFRKHEMKQRLSPTPPPMQMHSNTPAQSYNVHSQQPSSQTGIVQPHLIGKRSNGRPKT